MRVERRMMPELSVPSARVRTLNDAPLRPERRTVLYWMTAFRRPRFNFALQHAVVWARRLRKPLLVFEPLRCDYPWASVRLHRFVLEGMSENARTFAREGVSYFPYLEQRSGEGRGLLARLAKDAALVVGDDSPGFFLPRMLEAAARRIDVRLDVIDSNGLMPLRATEKCFQTAYSFRRWLQRELPASLLEMPAAEPLAGVELPSAPALDSEIMQRWKPLRLGEQIDLAKLPIDQTVVASDLRGGWRSATQRWRDFAETGLQRYGDRQPRDLRIGHSGLSPWVHFGHLSTHELVQDVLLRFDWTLHHLDPRPRGARLGYWGVPPAAEAFLDQVVTWRELGFNRCVTDDRHDQYESLPSWAQQSLASRANDPRPHVYTVEELEGARTHDPLWNAAQTQLVREGRMPNYLRMLWGKKILHWSRCPRDALAVMIELNNRYALDGRDPNSYSGIFWVLGRYDRPWAPARPIFGSVRYMSSESAARKFRVAEYIARYGGRRSIDKSLHAESQHSRAD